MASYAAESSSTTTVVEHRADPEQVANEVVRLKLSKKAQSDKKVSWTQETVDNENMGKKKSKCCCIYVKQRAFDESESDSSADECEHCSGHVEKRRAQPDHPPERGEHNSKGGDTNT